MVDQWREVTPLQPRQPPPRHLPQGPQPGSVLPAPATGVPVLGCRHATGRSPYAQGSLMPDINAVTW